MYHLLKNYLMCHISYCMVEREGTDISSLLLWCQTCPDMLIKWGLLSRERWKSPNQTKPNQNETKTTKQIVNPPSIQHNQASYHEWWTSS